MKRFAFPVLAAGIAAWAIAAMAQTPSKHPGAEQKDCSIVNVSTCAQWDGHTAFGGYSGYEMWREERFSANNNEITMHSIRVTDANHNFRGASVTTNELRDTKSTTRVFTWGNQAKSYDENCELHDSPQSTAETHAYVIFVDGVGNSGFSVNFEHTLKGDTVTKYRRLGFGRLERDDSVQDLTRCKDPNFPWSYLRAANLKPLTNS